MGPNYSIGEYNERYCSDELKTHWIFYVRSIERKLWHFQDPRNLVTFSETDVFSFVCHTFVISKPIFKIYQWKMFVLRSCIQVKYLVLNYYHANIVSRAFPWRSPCWPLSPTRQQKTGAYSDTIHHQCSKLYVVFPKICTYIPAKFKLDCDITGHRFHTVDDIIEDVIM